MGKVNKDSFKITQNVLKVYYKEHWQFGYYIAKRNGYYLIRHYTNEYDLLVKKYKRQSSVIKYLDKFCSHIKEMYKNDCYKIEKYDYSIIIL